MGNCIGLEPRATPPGTVLHLDRNGKLQRWSEEQLRRDEERRRADAEQLRRDEERRRADAEQYRRDEERRRADAEKEQRRLHDERKRLEGSRLSPGTSLNQDGNGKLQRQSEEQRRADEERRRRDDEQRIEERRRYDMQRRAEEEERQRRIAAAHKEELIIAARREDAERAKRLARMPQGWQEARERHSNKLCFLHIATNKVVWTLEEAIAEFRLDRLFDRLSAPVDVPGEWVRRSDSGPERKSFGAFQCEDCDTLWVSAHAYNTHHQACKRCEAWILPSFVWVNEEKQRRRNRKVRELDPNKPHDSARCGACQAGKCLSKARRKY